MVLLYINSNVYNSNWLNTTYKHERYMQDMRESIVQSNQLSSCAFKSVVNDLNKTVFLADLAIKFIEAHHHLNRKE